MNRTEVTTFNQEGFNFALQFIRTDNDDLDDKADKAKKVLDVVMQRLSEIRNAHGMTMYVLGGLIHELRKGPDGAEVWRRVPGTGYQIWWQFGDFCEHVLNVKLRKANELEFLWEKSRRIDFTPEEIESLGWSASDHIVRLANNRNDVDLLLEEYDQSHNNKEFIERAKVRMNKHQEPNGTKPPPVAHILRKAIFDENEAKVFDESIEAAAKDMERVLGITTNSKECLLYIIVKWREWRKARS